MLLKTLRKVIKKKAETRAFGDKPLVRYIKGNIFMLNQHVDVDENVSVVDYEGNIIILTDNFDKIDIEPRKIIIKNGRFVSGSLVTLLSSIYTMDENTDYVLEEVKFEDENENECLIGYSITNRVI